jgi:hypothetical protein
MHIVGHELHFKKIGGQNIVCYGAMVLSLVLVLVLVLVSTVDC